MGPVLLDRAHGQRAERLASRLVVLLEQTVLLRRVSVRITGRATAPHELRFLDEAVSKGSPFRLCQGGYRPILVESGQDHHPSTDGNYSALLSTRRGLASESPKE